ncbi:MAG: hypothetical protein U0869_20615 [Chloroflexota bacterium]
MTPYRTRAIALVLIAAASMVGGTVAAQSPSPSRASSVPSPSAPPAALVEPLAGDPTTVAGQRIDLVRITLPPGAVIGPIAQLGTSVSQVESGEIIVRADAGTVLAGLPGVLATGQERAVPPNGTVVEGPGAVMTWRNDGTVPAVVVTMRMVEEARVTPPTDAPDRDLSQQVSNIYRRQGKGGRQPDRLVVKDRSGMVLGVRFATPAEARFIGSDLPGSSALNVLPTHRKELLIHWPATGCGPQTTIDISRDLDHIRVREQGPDCPVSPGTRAVVLELQGPWFDSTGLDVWLERDPG